MNAPDEKWFRERLTRFLQIRHPPKQWKERFIERRSISANACYRRNLADGISESQALRAADKVLFQGLLFSKFDTVSLILATDFPTIPENQRQEVALKLVHICAPIFQTYKLGDDFTERPEFRQLKEELRIGIRNWIDENGVPGYRSPVREERRLVSYSKQPRYRKRNRHRNK